MTKNILIAGLAALLVLSIVAGAIAQASPGNKPNATIKTEQHKTERLTVHRPTNPSTGMVNSQAVVAIPFTVQLTDPVTRLIIRELSITAQVNLAQLSNKGQGLELFLVDGKAKLIEAVEKASVTITNPDIEEWEIITDANGDVVSVPMRLNALVTVGGFYSERVRFQVEGLTYTTLDPFSTNINDLFADIEANTITAYSQ